MIQPRAQEKTHCNAHDQMENECPQRIPNMQSFCRVAACSTLGPQAPASSARRRTIELATSQTFLLSLLTNAPGQCQPAGMMLAWTIFPSTEQARKMKHL
ncbi:hypothetical protein CVIRNUC_000183 [Coccomyxa viridis]|uniref:Uncharacterized protein n=1 Tax=Coccomyxa viridis TaxID=1274662 RepID=A0AAV1HTF8_9CHLO|nr:hypothetical protein CVIRNUC_000183 [Coccomyxa viridis]